MADLIDRQAVIRMLRGEAVAKFPPNFVYGLVAASAELEKLPTVDAVEIDVVKKWLYEIAMNNVGQAVEDMAAACEEIASRLDGLRRFAEERRGGMDNTAFDSIYPLTIVSDRYCGVYSGGDFTAWNLNPCDVPKEIYSGDVECMGFWHGVDGDVLSGKIRSDIVCGIGNTPKEAVAHLYIRIGGVSNG